MCYSSIRLDTILTFILGTITGIVSTYLGSRWAAKAKYRDSKIHRDKEFATVKEMMPMLIKEMNEDFKNTSNREFYIIPSKNIVFNAQKSIAYYENEHENLKSNIAVLKEYNFIKDITETNTPKYLITDDFLDHIKKCYNT